MSTLVVYASKHGTAKHCAEILSSKLVGQVNLLNVREEKVPELSQYSKIIIGGSIYAGRIQKEILEFCNKHIKELNSKKLGLYICCMIEKDADKQLTTVFPKELLDSSIVKKNFGGEFKFKEMSFWEKLMCKMVAKMLAKEDPDLVFDMKEDLSKLSMENIDEMAKIMNTAS
ncbi:MAG TPA: flavodoxin [Clostridium sp.]|mgnify:FL=1|jgi:menaquinone-dependent protoporphyrinogen oxidase|nr:flavodoxin [Clostridium sp.]